MVSKAWRVLREQGPTAVVKRASVRLFGDDSITRSLVRYDDALAVDWSAPHPSTVTPRDVGPGPYVTAWIMSPPGNNSGGHQNIFRFIKVLEDAGHEVRVYLYSTDTKYSAGEVRSMLTSSSSYPDVRATVEDFPAAGLPDDIDAIFATGWETAYPSFRDPSTAARLYFVQDFEPYFYPVGSEYALAEATYRFGFTGVTAGSWLSTKLADEYGMTTSHFDFGSDDSTYRMTVTEPRSEVFFYARPATERRGFELGIMALDLVARARPEVTINLVGEDLRHLDIPFRHRNLAGLQVADLNEVYNRCAAGLVLSFTNMSLLPLELLGAGVIPVVNDGPNNRLVSDNPFISFVAPSPRALADGILEVFERPDAVEHATRASASVGSADWAASGRQFLAAVEGALRG